MTELILGVSLLFLGSAALTEELKAVAVVVRHHVAEAWSIELANRLVYAATERNLLVTVLALSCDGALSFVEGWALYRRYRWARWLVVGATACLLPVEGVALARHFSATRISLLCVNALIVIYLVQGRVAIARESQGRA